MLYYTLEPPGLVHLIQACPTKEIRHDVVLPRLIREVPAGLNPKGKGVMGLSPLALRVVVYRVVTTHHLYHGWAVPPCHNAELDVFQGRRTKTTMQGSP